MAKAYIALGSNLEGPAQQVQAAALAIAALPECQFIKLSSLYETAPVDCPEHEATPVPNFINAVLMVTTTLSPHALLTALHTIENEAGRQRPYINAPRVLDCDLLLYDDLIINDSTLTLPHPRMHQRGFVLLPLFEIDPHLSIPNHGKIATLIAQQPFTGIKRQG
ncbi:FolK 7,8-dihydro-6-hydroxymethylpterin-pyrophosphokinase [Methylophilaceae bacterium]